MTWAATCDSAVNSERLADRRDWHRTPTDDEARHRRCAAADTAAETGSETTHGEV